MFLTNTYPEYNFTLRFPDMALVDVGGAKQNLLPPELCEILPNQAFKGKLQDEQTAQMIRVAANPPLTNANAIVGHGIRELGFTGDSVQLNAFGVSVSSEMVVVPGRILPVPTIHYASGRAMVDEKAGWNLKGVKFHRGATLQNWGVLVLLDGNQRDEFPSKDDPELMQMCNGFMQMCRASGMVVKDGPKIGGVRLPKKDGAKDPTRAAAIAAIDNALKTQLGSGKPSIVLIILSNGDKHIYSGIKKLCDSQLDLREFRFAPRHV